MNDLDHNYFHFQIFCLQLLHKNVTLDHRWKHARLDRLKAVETTAKLICTVKLSELSSAIVPKRLNYETTVWHAFASQQIIVPQDRRALAVADFKFQWKTFKISLFCCSGKTLGPRATNCFHVQVDKGTYVAKRQPDQSDCQCC